jgi:predicted ferric reductase
MALLSNVESAVLKPSIQKADPVARRRAVWLLSALILLSLAAIILLNIAVGSLNDWIASHAELLIRHHYLSFLVMLLPVTPVLVLSGWMIRFAGRVVKSQRFPPPNSQLMRDVRVIEGRPAVLRARIAQILCWIILLSAAAIPLLVWSIFYQLGAAN